MPSGACACRASANEPQPTKKGENERQASPKEAYAFAPSRSKHLDRCAGAAFACRFAQIACSLTYVPLLHSRFVWPVYKSAQHKLCRADVTTCAWVVSTRRDWRAVRFGAAARNNHVEGRYEWRTAGV
eukprot:6210508-Pleurochrysis_carterae.AAC.2